MDATNVFPDSVIDAHGLSLVKSKVGTIGGTITTGYGIFDESYYFGLDFCVDITNNKNHSQTHELYQESKIKTAGFVPTIALRFGRFFPSIDCLIYGRLGLTGLHNDFQNYKTFRTSFCCEGISPIAGIGVEKNVLEHCFVRLEGDYRFVANKKKRNLIAYTKKGKLITGYRGSIENRARGYAIRLMCIYHF